jgi:hypothetical protein
MAELDNGVADYAVAVGADSVGEIVRRDTPSPGADLVDADADQVDVRDRDDVRHQRPFVRAARCSTRTS